MTEQRYPDALPEFKQAVQLDPQYLNAWKQLSQLGEKIHMWSKEREAIPFTIVASRSGRTHSLLRLLNLGFECGKDRSL
jgi:hypothetical protein